MTAFYANVLPSQIDLIFIGLIVTVRKGNSAAVHSEPCCFPFHPVKVLLKILQFYLMSSQRTVDCKYLVDPVKCFADYKQNNTVQCARK